MHNFFSGDIAQYVREEIRRLKRRRLLPDNRQRATNVRASMDDEDSSPSQSPPRTTSPPLNHSLLATPALTTAASPASKDKALFTFKQVWLFFLFFLHQELQSNFSQYCYLHNLFSCVLDC
jgi:hypothetical protein